MRFGEASTRKDEGPRVSGFHFPITRSDMKKLILIAIFLFTPVFAYGQCTDGSVCISQTTIDRATAAVTELAAARQVIEAFGKERAATQAEREAAARLVDRLNNVIAVQDRLATEYDKVILLYKAVIAEQAALIERLQKMLNAPKSAWQRFASALKTITYILAGAALGRGL